MDYEVKDAILDTIQGLTTFQVVLGSNPTKESIALGGYGAPRRIYKDKDTDYVLNLTINGKSASQQKIEQELSKIHRKLMLRADYPQGDNWHIYSIETIASPRLIAVEESDRAKWIYGSSIAVKFYHRGLKGELNNA